MLRVTKRGRDLQSLTFLLVFALLIIAAGEARASHFPEPALRDYVHTAWTQHDGVPLSKIKSITQTTDGYLWLTTADEGLLRVDGVRFVSMSSLCGQVRSDGAGDPSMRFFVDRHRRLWLWGKSLGYDQ